MTRRPQDDPRVTDLRRYRRERERARRAERKPHLPGGEPLIGNRRGATIILVLVILALLAFVVLASRPF